MKYKILIQNQKIWIKDFEKVPQFLHKSIKENIQNLDNIPWSKNLDIKKLKKYKTANFRIRIGNYRVLFDQFKNEKIIKLYRVLHRSKLY